VIFDDRLPRRLQCHSPEEVPMPKGNHVYNNLDGTIFNSYKVITEKFGQNREFDALAGSGGAVDEALQLFNAKYPTAYTAFRAIMDHPSCALMHTVQDDEPVAPNDPNSIAFGKAANKFSLAVMDWVYGSSETGPTEEWRQLVNIGVDKEAQANYIEKGSSQEGTPKQKEQRASRCNDLECFIKGELTKLVLVWLFNLRRDLKQTNAVDYATKPKEWQQVLAAAKDMFN
jgi:hypothetical protein